MVGLNKTTCSEINMWLKNGDLERVSLKTKTEGAIDPIKQIDAENTKLKGFDWQYEKRPKSRFELHTKTLNLKKKSLIKD